MPRGRNIGINKRPIINISNISMAIKDIENGMTIETAAKKHTIAKTTLWRHYKRHQLSTQQTCAYVEYPENTQIFTAEEEIFLAEYIKTLTELQYGLNENAVRKFVYLIAQKNKKDIPKSWKDKEYADMDWLAGFVKRNPSLLLKKPSIIGSSTSLQSKIDFNVFPNHFNDSISLYFLTKIYYLMKLTNTITPTVKK